MLSGIHFMSEQLQSVGFGRKMQYCSNHAQLFGGIITKDLVSTDIKLPIHPNRITRDTCDSANKYSFAKCTAYRPVDIFKSSSDIFTRQFQADFRRCGRRYRHRYNSRTSCVRCLWDLALPEGTSEPGEGVQTAPGADSSKARSGGSTVRSLGATDVRGGIQVCCEI